MSKEYKFGLTSSNSRVGQKKLGNQIVSKQWCEWEIVDYFKVKNYLHTCAYIHWKALFLGFQMINVWTISIQPFGFFSAWMKKKFTKLIGFGQVNKGNYWAIFCHSISPKRSVIQFSFLHSMKAEIPLFLMIPSKQLENYFLLKQCWHVVGYVMSLNPCKCVFS